MTLAIRNDRPMPKGRQATKGKTPIIRLTIEAMRPGEYFDLSDEHRGLFRHIYAIAKDMGAKIRTERQLDGRLTVWRVQ